MHKYTKKYRMRGGGALPEPVFTKVSEQPTADPAAGQARIAAAAAAQNQANKALSGGRGKRSSGKRSRSRRSIRSRSKRSKRSSSSKRRFKQRGGATICGGSPINGADGYGYISPNNCLLVPTVNNPAAQALAISSMDSLNIGNANKPGDSLIGQLS